MTKFRVALEASAAICIEIEVEVDDRDAAEVAGEKWLKANRDTCGAVVENLISVDDIATRGYAETLKLPITYVGVSGPDDEGFEVVDVFEEGDLR